MPAVRTCGVCGIRVVDSSSCGFGKASLDDLAQEACVHLPADRDFEGVFTDSQLTQVIEELIDDVFAEGIDRQMVLGRREAEDVTAGSSENRLVPGNDQLEVGIGLRDSGEDVT